MQNGVVFNLNLADDGSFNRVINNANNGLGQLRAAAAETAKAVQTMQANFSRTAGLASSDIDLRKAMDPRGLYIPKLAPSGPDNGRGMDDLRAPIAVVGGVKERELGQHAAGFREVAEAEKDALTGVNLWGAGFALAGAIAAPVLRELEARIAAVRDRVLDLANYANTAAARSMEALASATREVSAAQADFAVKMNHVTDGFNQADSIAAQAVAMYDDQRQATKLLNDETEKRNLLLLDQRAALGEINPLQAAIAKNAETNRFANIGDLQAGDAARAKEKIEKDKLANLIELSADAEAKVKAAQALRADPLAAINNQSGRIANLDENIRAAKTAADNAAADLAAARSNPFNAFTGKGSSMQAGIQAAQTTQKTYNDLLAQRVNMEAHLVELQNAQKDPTAYLTNQQDRAVQFAREAVAQRTKLANLQTLNKQQAANRSAISDARDAAMDAQNQLAAAQFISGNRPNFGSTDLERMGAVSGRGGPTILADHARKTADNTAETVRLLQQLVQANTANGPLLQNRY